MKLQILKDLKQQHPDVILDGSLVHVKKIVVQAWVNGSGGASEHVRATVVTNNSEIILDDENLNVDMTFYCGLRIVSTDRGLGCFVGEPRISLIQALRYASEPPSWPILTLEMIAT